MKNLVSILFLLIASLSVNAKTGWHEETLPESYIIMKPCYEGKYVACKLMWKGKIVIYDCVNFKEVFQIKTRNEDYFFSASGTKLYILYRDKNELLTFDLDQKKKTGHITLDKNFVATEFVTALKNPDFAIMTIRALNYKNRGVFLNLKTGKIVSFNGDGASRYSVEYSDLLRVDEKLRYFASINKEEVYKIEDPAKGSIKYHKSWITKYIKKNDPYFRMSFDGKLINNNESLEFYTGSYFKELVKYPKARFLAIDSYHYITYSNNSLLVKNASSLKSSYKIPLPKQNLKIDNILISSINDRVVIQAENSLYIHKLHVGKTINLKAKAGETFSFDFNMPANFELSLLTELQDASIENGVLTWEVPEEFKDDGQELLLEINEPTEPETKRKKIYIEVDTVKSD